MDDIKQKLADLKFNIVDDDRNVIKEKIIEQSPCIVAEMKTGFIIFATKRINETFGYIYNELEGKLITDLMPEGYRKRHDEHLKKYMGDPKFRQMGTTDMKLKGLRKDSTEFDVKISLEPFFHDQTGFVLATIL